MAKEARSGGIEEETPTGKKAKKGRGNFFSVERATWEKVCTLENTNAAIAFLVLAQGSGADHITTSWSANAVSIYTRMSRHRGTEAIDELRRLGVLERVKGGTKPQYKIKNPKLSKQKSEPEHAERIWLPNALVTGARNEPPPLARLRSTQDILLLRLFIDLYRAQNLTDEGGISRNVIFKEYKRTEIGSCAQYVLYGFNRVNTTACFGHDILKPHYVEPSEEDEDEDDPNEDNPNKEFWERLKALEGYGLVKWVTYLCETDAEGGGELIHPCTYDPDDKKPSLEKRLGAAAHEAGEAILETMIAQGHKGAAYKEGSWGQLVPVKQQFRQATLIGIALLHYRPHTSKTSTWYGQLDALCNRWLNTYGELTKKHRPEREQRLRAVG